MVLGGQRRGNAHRETAWLMTAHCSGRRQWGTMEHSLGLGGIGGLALHPRDNSTGGERTSVGTGGNHIPAVLIVSHSLSRELYSTGLPGTAHWVLLGVAVGSRSRLPRLSQ